MRRMCCLLACLVLLCGAALAEKTVSLPGGAYELVLPEETETGEGAEDEELCLVFLLPGLEIDVFAYDRGESTLWNLAQQLAEKGTETEIREINGIEALCYRTTDEADGADCIGYVLEDGGQLVELACWYGTGEAAETAGEIIGTLRRAEEI